MIQVCLRRHRERQHKRAGPHRPNRNRQPPLAPKCSALFCKPSLPSHLNSPASTTSTPVSASSRPSTNAAFPLFNLKPPHKSHHDLLVQIFSQGWTTNGDLFLGANACVDYQGGTLPPALDTATLEARCANNTQIYAWDQTCGLGDGTCFFTGSMGGVIGARRFSQLLAK